MNATSLYVTTCRLVMQAEPENRESWTELYKLLPYLRQSLSCTVCGQLLSEPLTPTETTCQHHVCRKCLGGKKRLKPTCSWCKDYGMYVDNVQIKLILQCYRKLCEYIKFTPIYCKLCSIYNNGGQFSLTDMIDEAIGNSCAGRVDESSSNSVQCESESDSKENISIPQTSGANLLITPVNTSHSVTPKQQQSWPLSTQAPTLAQPTLAQPTLAQPTLAQPTLVQPTLAQPTLAQPTLAQPTLAQPTLAQPTLAQPTPVQPTPVHPTLAQPTLAQPTPAQPTPAQPTPPAPPAPPAPPPPPSTVNLGLVHVSSPPPVNSIAQPVSCHPSGSVNTVKSVIPTPAPVMQQTTQHFQPQAVATTSCVTSGSGLVPGTIFPSTNIVKHSVIKEAPYPKHNSSVNNGSSMYSVMYADGDSTKITIKRKPPDMESTNKSVPVEPETIAPSTQELIKKPKPKPKPKPKRKGCRCGNATPTPGKLTCCGQRCPCYVEAKACIECRCRGCRNPHRPGGKKVRPVIPQLANIQIHQVQPVHGRSSASSIVSGTTTTSASSIMQTPISSATITNTTLPQTIRAVQAMQAVQAVHGVGAMQAVTGGVHQLISLGRGVVQAPLPQGLGVHPVAGLAVKPVSLALASVPTQLLINDDRSTSNSASDTSDVEVDI
ncbi:protein piccolo-like [Penaeus japonicus]|uniref:protein piccolo-like n=1 Tax=Penaeus japonicus TaxID=27405 RepID=UPI001C70D28C|nr:protein piccolo-like [Penaeus japonicus]